MSLHAQGAQPIDQGLQVMSLRESTYGTLPIAMASPAPLPPLADTDSSGMSVTGLLSPNPAVNLTAELSAVMQENEFWQELENNFLDLTPDKAQQSLTTALTNQGTTATNINMPSSGHAEMRPAAVGHVNTGTEPARSAQTAPSVPLPDLLTARTQNAQTALVQAANDLMPVYGPATTLGPASSKGPYSNRNPEQEREVEKLQQLLDTANENANRNFELMKQKWDDQQLK